MFAVITFAIFPLFTGLVIDQVCGYNECHSRNQQPELIKMEDLLEYQQGHTGTKNQQGEHALVVFFESMGQRVHTNQHGQQNHQKFKPEIVDDVDAKNRQAGQKKGKHCAVYGTGNGSGNSKGIEVDFEHGGRTKLRTLQQSCILIAR
jgi:hypothetical protein